MSLRVEGLSVSYGKIQVLWDVTLHINCGEIVSMIGANGAGKSTLLKSIIGVVGPQRGVISFEGKSVLKESIHARVRNGIAYVPEGRRLFYGMTVEENLRMGSKRGAENLHNQLQKVHDIFPVLEERRKQYAGNLSGGEQQMLAIGRALMSQPKLMLLDELSFGLAPVLFDRVLDSIQEINRSGVTILLAEQNAERALEVSGRTYVIENGRMVMEGESKAMIDSPSVQNAYIGVGETKADI